LTEDKAIQEYNKLFAEQAANILEAYRNYDRLLSLLKSAGYSQTEAITKMADDARRLGLKGFSEATIRRGLPDQSKKSTKPGPRKSNQMITYSNQARLVVPKEQPTIPPPPQTVTEAEIIPERQPPPLPRIKFNTDTFRRELRIALINGDTVWLTYNNGEVIEMKER
jgi:hypothetical protein